MSNFVVEVMPNKEESDMNNRMVKETDTGWFFPNLNVISANELCAKLNEVSNPKTSLMNDFNDWATRITWLDKTNRRILEIEKIYDLETVRILEEIKTNNIDIKAIYGGNNDKTRKKYIDEQLSELLEEKEELKFLKENDNRRISYLKKIIDLKMEIMENE